VFERFFHFEFFREKTGKIVALEVNIRPPGGMTTDMFNYANDIDIYQEWANVVMYNSFMSSYGRKYHCGYIGRKISKQYLHSHREVLEKLGPLLVHHTPVSGVFRLALGDYGYIVRSESLEEIQRAISFVHAIQEYRA